MGLPPLAGAGTDRVAMRDVDEVMRQEGAISFALSVPPHDLVPVAEIADAIHHALEIAGPRVLAFGPVEGTHELRSVLAERMRLSGAMGPADGVVIVSGSTQGLSLAARVLVERGDEVVVASPTYLGIIQCFEMAGARLIGVPVDADGIRTDSLAEVLARRRIRLMVLQPNYHNPTGSTLSAERREQVLWLARRHSVPILEDDPYGALHYSAEPPGTLKEHDRHGLVVYLSTFSKTISPGLRVGWMCGPAAVIARIAVAKQSSDLNTNSLGQSVVASLLADGRYDAQVNRLRLASAERMHRLLRRLDSMGEILGRDRDPAGGLHVWCSLKVGDSNSVVSAAAREGVAVLGGTAFYPSGSHPGAGSDRIRISLPPSDPETIDIGLRRLGKAIAQLPERPRRTVPARLTAVVV
jgi:DNA-binding transcriptional MocR family regulator